MPSPLAVESLELRDVPAALFSTLPTFNFSDPAVLDHARAIAADGRSQGRNTDAFIKVGDSNSAPGFGTGYLFPLGAGYNPFASGLTAAHPELLDTLGAYQSGVNSFARVSSAAIVGATTIEMIPRVPGEVAATNAGVALVMIGTNDSVRQWGYDFYREQMTVLTDTLVGMGVVPVLCTIPENVFSNGQYTAAERQVNQAIADVADANHLPLWNLWRDLAGLPSAGLTADGLHVSAAPTGGGDLTPAGLLFGQNLRNLEALQVLDWFREQVVAAPPTVIAPLDWTPISSVQTVYAVGRGEGQGPSVSVYDAATGREVNRFTAFDPAFAGGVRVAVADVNGDMVPDIITVPGPGGGPIVRVFNGADGSVLANFFAFDPAFRNGVGSLDAADFDGDGRAEIVVGAGAGGGPVVAVFRGGDFAEVQRFFAYDPQFRGGVNVAAGTFAGIGPGIATTPGAGGGPVVRLFAFGAMESAFSFFAGDPADASGFTLAAGDLDGNGTDELAVGPGRGVPRVRVFDPALGSERTSIPAGSETSRSGVRLATIAGRSTDTLLVGFGAGGPVSLRGYTGLSGDATTLPPDDPGRAYGVNIG